MKSYDETIASVFATGDMIIEKKRSRAKKIRMTSAAVSGLCAAIIVGVGVLSDKNITNPPERHINSEIIISESSFTAPASTAEPIGNTTQTIITSQKNYSTQKQPGTNTAAVNNNSQFNTSTVKNKDETIIQAGKSSDSEKQADVSERSPSPVSSVISKSQVTVQSTEVQVTVNVTTVAETDVCLPERSIIMKKITAFLAALSVGAISIPFTSTAADLILPPEIDQNNTFGYTNHSIYMFEKEIVDYTKFQKGERETDINGDGKFDLLDCYEVFALEDMDNRLASDVNISVTKENIDDYKNLLSYFLITNDIKTEYITPEFYNDPYFTDNIVGKEKNIQAMNEMFAYRVCGNLILLPNGYTIFEDMIDKDIIDLDFDSDGVLTPADMNIFGTFMKDREETVDKFSITTELQPYQPFQERNRVFSSFLNRVNETCDIVHVFGDYTFTEQDVLSEDVFNKCEKNLKALCEYNFFTDYRYFYNGAPHIVDSGLIQSLISTANGCFTDYHGYLYGGNEDLDSCSEFFFPDLIFKNMEMLPEYSEASYYDTILPGGESEITANIIDIYCKKTGYKELTPDLQMGSHILYERAYEQFCDDVANGVRPAPDPNYDGVMDAMDMLAIHEMYRFAEVTEYPGSDKTTLTLEQWNNIKTNCDYDNNGISGDYTDFSIGQLYIICEYLIKNPDSISSRTLEAILESEDEISNQQNLEVMECASIDRSGDANCDEETGLADALLILQNNANSEKYPLSVTGNFNADVYSTGDGITPLDALEIQKWDAEKAIG